MDFNTGASLLLQSGSRWLGLTLDLIGSVIVFTSIMVAILMGQTGPVSLGLLVSYRCMLAIYKHTAINGISARKQAAPNLSDKMFSNEHGLGGVRGSKMGVVARLACNPTV